MSPARTRSHDARVFFALLFGLAAIAGAAYAAAVIYTGQRVPRGTSVEGVGIGGLRPAMAERRLSDQLVGRAEAPLAVSADGHHDTLAPAELGLRVDVAATVRSVEARPSWDPHRLWASVAGGTEHPAVVTVDADALRRGIAAFAGRVDHPAVQGAVRFDDQGDATARYPRAGILLDRTRSGTIVRSAFLSNRSPDQRLALPTRTDRPALDVKAVSDAMSRFANPAVSEPVLVRLGHDGVEVPPSDYSAALSMTTRDGRLVPHLDRTLLKTALAPAATRLEHGPKDARFELRGGRPHVVPSRTGVSFRPDDVASKFLAALTRSGSRRVVEARGEKAEPDFTTADARRLGVTERVSHFETRFPYAAYRNVNLGRAAHLIDGTLLRPGKTFSLNRTVGQRTPENGFTQGYVIADGVYAKELGGGVSQVTTTTYNAAFFAGMQDVEHQAHSFYINRYPVGREATVVWPSVDLKFKNTTPYAVWIRASITKATPHRQGTMRVAIYSTRYWDISTSRSPRYAFTRPSVRHLSTSGCVPHHGYDGFQINVYRVFRRHGSSAVDHRETIHTTYQPSDTVVCS